MQDRTKKIGVAALGAIVLALAAVGASAQAPARAEVYRLAEVEGRALPAVVEQEGDCRDELLGGTLTLAADGTPDLDVEGLTVGTRSASALSVRLAGGQTVVFRP